MRFYNCGDAILLAQDNEMDRYVDSRVSQGAVLYQNMGSQLFELFRAPIQHGLGLYFLLTPRTVNNCLRLRKRKPLVDGKVDEFATKKLRYAALRTYFKGVFQSNVYATNAVYSNVCSYYKRACLSKKDLKNKIVKALEKAKTAGAQKDDIEL